MNKELRFMFLKGFLLTLILLVVFLVSSVLMTSRVWAGNKTGQEPNLTQEWTRDDCQAALKKILEREPTEEEMAKYFKPGHDQVSAKCLNPAN